MRNTFTYKKQQVRLFKKGKPNLSTIRTLRNLNLEKLPIKRDEIQIWQQIQGELNQ